MRRIRLFGGRKKRPQGVRRTSQAQVRASREPTMEFRRDPPPDPPLERPRAECAPPLRAPTASRDDERTVLVGNVAAKAVVGVLIGLEGAVLGGVWKLHDGENPIGRYVLGVDDLEISRDHAKIIHRSGSFGLQATSDHSPTLLDGRPVTAEILSDGATIRLGPANLVLRFRVV
jgi:hypothetical protein